MPSLKSEYFIAILRSAGPGLFAYTVIVAFRRPTSSTATLSPHSSTRTLAPKSLAPTCDTTQNPTSNSVSRSPFVTILSPTTILESGRRRATHPTFHARAPPMITLKISSSSKANLTSGRRQGWVAMML